MRTERRAMGGTALLITLLATAASGCFAVRLPPRVDEEEFARLAGRLYSGEGGVVVWEGEDADPRQQGLRAALESSGAFQWVLPRDCVPLVVDRPIRWTVKRDDALSSGDDSMESVCLSPLTVLSLGIIPQYGSRETVEFYRVRRVASAPSMDLWIAVPGTRGQVVGFAAMLVALLPDWELVGTARAEADRVSDERFVCEFLKFIQADAEGRAPTTDPETLELLERARAQRAGE